MSNNKDLIQKINDVEILSQSQMDRMDLQNSVQKDLIEFVQTQIAKVSSQNSIKTIVLEKIKQKIKDEDDILSWPILVKLLEVTSKIDSDVTLGLFKIISDSQKQIPLVPPQNPDNKTSQEKLPEVTNEEMNTMKDFLTTIKKIRESEFSKKE